MSMANPLVAGPVDMSTPFTGAFLLEDGEALAAAIESGDWVAGGLAAFSAAADTVAAVSDPLGSLIATGLGWVMEHLEPLKGWMNDLTGDAGEVAGFAQTWSNVSTQMVGSADELARILRDLEEMDGDAIGAYVAFQADAEKHLRAAGSWAEAMSTGLSIASMIVKIIHDLVRDAIAEIVGAIISYAAELVCTLGLATPLVIEQVSTRVASLVGRIGKSITNLLSSAKQLGKLLEKLKALFRKAEEIFTAVLHGGAPSRPAAGVPSGAPHGGPVPPHGSTPHDPVPPHEPVKYDPVPPHDATPHDPVPPHDTTPAGPVPPHSPTTPHDPVPPRDPDAPKDPVPPKDTDGTKNPDGTKDPDGTNEADGTKEPDEGPDDLGEGTTDPSAADPNPEVPDTVRDEILDTPKGERPAPETYLPPEYISEHLDKFDDGSTRFMTETNVNKYGIAQADGKLFVMPTSEVEKAIAQTGGDPRALEAALGLPDGFFENDAIVRVDIHTPDGDGIHFPSGNEAGANDQWLPGGHLPTGIPEAVIDASALGPDDYTVIKFH